MALWDKLRQELDRAGRVAQDAIDEGRTKIDLLRARQLADKAAQALGYAVYHARTEGGDLDAEAYTRLSATLAGHEAEVKRLEEQLESARRGGTPADVAPGTAAGAAGAAAAASTDAPPTPGDASTAPAAAGTTDAATQPGAAPGAPPSAGTAPEEPWSPTI